MAKRKILQIIPADGWVAVYLLEDSPWYDTVALKGWVLIEERDYEDEEGDRRVKGLEAQGEWVELAPNAANFHVYTRQEWIDRDAQYYVKTAQENKERRDRKKGIKNDGA